MVDQERICELTDMRRRFPSRGSRRIADEEGEGNLRFFAVAVKGGRCELMHEFAKSGVEQEF